MRAGAIASGLSVVFLFAMAQLTSAQADGDAPDSSRDLRSLFSRKFIEFVDPNACRNPTGSDTSPQLPNGAICAHCQTVAGANASPQLLSRQARRAALALAEQTEREFFRDLVADQRAQTACELTVLNALDSRKNAGRSLLDRVVAPADGTRVAGADARSHQALDTTAVQLQAPILEDLWNKLPAIEAAEREYAAIRVPADPYLGRQAQWSTHEALAARVEQRRSALAAQAAADSKRKTIYQSIWSGMDPAFQRYIARVRSQFRDGDLTRDAFIARALGDQGDLSFQAHVIAPMLGSSRQRQRDLESYARRDFSVDPRRQPARERAIKQTLMETDAAIDFMLRSDEYRDDFESMSCVLLNKYRLGPELVSKTLTGAALIVGVGLTAGAGLALAGGASVGALATGGASMLALGATNFGAATWNSCGSGGGQLIRSMTHGDLCAQLSESGANQVQILQENIRKRNCGTALAWAAVGSFVPGSGASRVGALAVGKSISVMHEGQVIAGTITRLPGTGLLSRFTQQTVRIETAAGAMNITADRLLPALAVEGGAVSQGTKVLVTSTDGRILEGHVVSINQAEGRAIVMRADGGRRTYLLEELRTPTAGWNHLGVQVVRNQEVVIHLKSGGTARGTFQNYDSTTGTIRINFSATGGGTGQGVPLREITRVEAGKIWTDDEIARTLAAQSQARERGRQAEVEQERLAAAAREQRIAANQARDAAERPAREAARAETTARAEREFGLIRSSRVSFKMPNGETATGSVTGFTDDGRAVIFRDVPRGHAQMGTAIRLEDLQIIPRQ